MGNKVKKRNFDKVILLGHSFGGALATVYASQYKNEIEKVVLISPAGLLEEVNPWLDRGRELGWVLGSNIIRYIQYKTLQRSITRGQKIIKEHESHHNTLAEKFRYDVRYNNYSDNSNGKETKNLDPDVEVDVLKGQQRERQNNKTSFEANVATVKW